MDTILTIALILGEFSLIWHTVALVLQLRAHYGWRIFRRKDR